MLKSSAEPWDYFPGIGPPYTAHLWLRNLSAEERAAEERKIEAEHRRERKEAFIQWRRHERIALVEEEIKLLRRWKKLPLKENVYGFKRTLAERCHCRRGSVYLMKCPSLVRSVFAGELYKIGHSKCLKKRLQRLQCVLDSRIELLTHYNTPIPRDLLENALHSYFRQYHVAWRGSDELFELPLREVKRFEATTAMIERHLIDIELIRLKAIRSRFRAEMSELD